MIILYRIYLIPFEQLDENLTRRYPREAAVEELRLFKA
ncbi:signal recognition particle subunit SEC65 [Peribacillus frigoritolerans]